MLGTVLLCSPVASQDVYTTNNVLSFALRLSGYMLVWM